MSDGAHEGVLPQRALRTILGGDHAPDPDEGLSAQEMRDWIKAAPEHPDGYDDTARRAAQLILLHWDAYPEDATADPYGLYASIKARSPDIMHKIVPLGLSGFQWGYAVNAARRVNELPPQPNPAIITVEVKEEE